MINGWENFLGIYRYGRAEYVGGGTLKQAFDSTLIADCRFLSDAKGELKSERSNPETANQLSIFRRNARKTVTRDGVSAEIGRDLSLEAHINAGIDRCLFETQKGYIGLCPQTARPGDLIYVLSRCPVPVVSQPYAQEPGEKVCYFRTFGHCYMHGIMDGEAVGMGLPREKVYIR
jgi:hypothetical protein